MLKRLPFILLLWLIADVYFFQAVKTVTANDVIMWLYWLLDVVLIAGICLIIFARLSNRSPQSLIAFLMAFMLLSFIPSWSGPRFYCSRISCACFAAFRHAVFG
jgi:hypothetical protein